VLNNPLLSTAYLAPIEYYAILLQETDCSIELHEHFVKQSIRNRCDIYGSNGKLQLTIPKQRKGSSKTIIKEIQISYKQDWQKQHWTAIQSAYNSSPFFEYYQDELQPFFEDEETLLVDFNHKLQEVILELLQQEEGNTRFTKEFQHEGHFSDFRNHRWKCKSPVAYDQIFMEKQCFIPNLSIIDLLFNLGPESSDYLHKLDIRR